ncbi:hypothetical protein [Marivita sp. GX14005]|uniref:hypothetical protein n=1 Tax=Marivita sp. GX14005 TaxID=2942276 RepID=UPI00201932BD|nr:hypothetical protein [Marivita sp. GX14005]MCL3880671.1 hypothetical protein [Marivita sp. GX14005]
MRHIAPLLSRLAQGAKRCFAGAPGRIVVKKRIDVNLNSSVYRISFVRRDDDLDKGDPAPAASGRTNSI